MSPNGPEQRMLKSVTTLQLADRPYHTAVSGDGRRFTASSPAGTCRLFNDELRQIDEIELGAGVDWLQTRRNRGAPPRRL